jgi:hypothetical protein
MKAGAPTSALDATDLPAFAEKPGDESRKSADLTTEMSRKNLRLLLVNALIDIDAGGSLQGAFGGDSMPGDYIS